MTLMKCTSCKKLMNVPARCTAVTCADCNSRRISREEMRKVYLRCVADTPSLTDTQATWPGFVGGGGPMLRANGDGHWFESDCRGREAFCVTSFESRGREISA